MILEMFIHYLKDGMNKRTVLLWISISLGATIPLGLLYVPLTPDAFILATHSISFIAFTFVFGIPIFLGASLFLESSEAHNTSNKSSSTIEKFLQFSIQFVVLVIFLLIYMVAFCVGVMLAFSILAGTDAPFILQLVPGVVLSAIVMTLYLSPVAAFFAMLFDSRKLSVIAGAILCFVITHATGYPIYSLTYREIAVLGPVYYFIALAVILSGLKFESPAMMALYFSMYIEQETLIIPTFFFILISIFSFMIAMKVYEYNYARWSLERVEKSASDDSIFRLSKMQIERLSVMKDRLKTRRIITGIILTLILAIIPISVNNYTTVRTNELSGDVYESPQAGEPIAIGNWLNNSFIAQGTPDFSRSLSCYCRIEIIDWGNLTEIQFECYLLDITMDEFSHLNESEITRRGSQHHEILDLRNNHGITHYEITNERNYVLTLRLIESEGQSMSGKLTVYVLIEIEAWGI
jgi:hypothetical protein